MKLRVIIGVVAVAAAVLFLAALAVADEPKGDEKKPEWPLKAPDKVSSVGVMKFQNDTSWDYVDHDFWEIMYERLKNSFKGVEFVKVERDKDTEPGAPLLLKEAERLGAKYHVDALLTGEVVEIYLPGGTYPSRGNPDPYAQGAISYKLVDTTQGLPLTDDVIADDGLVLYSYNIRTEEDLVGAVERHLVQRVIASLKKSGKIVSQEDKKKAESESKPDEKPSGDSNPPK
jgi:hypothetical protein